MSIYIKEYMFNCQLILGRYNDTQSVQPPKSPFFKGDFLELKIKYLNHYIILDLFPLIKGGTKGGCQPNFFCVENHIPFQLDVAKAFAHGAETNFKCVINKNQIVNFMNVLK